MTTQDNNVPSKVPAPFSRAAGVENANRTEFLLSEILKQQHAIASHLSTISANVNSIVIGVSLIALAVFVIPLLSPVLTPILRSIGILPYR